MEIHIQTLNEHWTEITAVYENKNFNCDQCGKYFARWCNLKVLIQNVHENFMEIHIQTLNEHWTEITAVYENKNFNCDQCGKYFARWCNLKVLIQNVHEIYSWIVNTMANI